MRISISCQLLYCLLRGFPFVAPLRQSHQIHNWAHFLKNWPFGFAFHLVDFLPKTYQNMASDTATTLTPIKRLLFNADAAVTLKHVKQVYGEKAITMTPAYLDNLVEVAKMTKRDANVYGDHAIKGRMVHFMRTLGHDVSGFADLLEKYRNNGSAAFCADIWSTCYGKFEEPEMFGWEVKMEAKYMAEKGLVYDDAVGTGKLPKGCFARMFTSVKNAKVKNVNRIGEKAHGITIELHRSKDELTKENRGKK